MTLKPIYIQALTTLVVTLIVINQSVWISNMYNLHKRELRSLANESAQKSVFMEVSDRGEAVGGIRVFSTQVFNPRDSARYFTKEIQTKDTTYVVNVDRQDPNTINKILQLVLKDELPIDLKKLNIFFKKELSEKYKVKNTYFDYIDLKTHKQIKSNRPKNASLNYLQTDTVKLDIMNTIGIIGYVEVPNVVILTKMGYQLGLSILLILIGMVSMIYLGRSFVVQWKIERLRQESVNSMTHEFKRPISNAVAMVSLIPFYIEKNDLVKVVNYANNTITELNKLTAYTERIQQISNNEKGSIVLNKVEVEISSLVQSIKDRYATINNDMKGTIINSEINTKNSFLFVDLLHFSNVLDNLVENAIKYSNNEVIINISVADSNDGVKIIVKDNGMGISTFDLKYVFDRFYRSNRKDLRTKTGFGLGLTYSKSIIEAHGGIISATSKINEGSEFTILLK